MNFPELSLIEVVPIFVALLPASVIVNWNIYYVRSRDTRRKKEERGQEGIFLNRSVRAAYIFQC